MKSAMSHRANTSQKLPFQSTPCYSGHVAYGVEPSPAARAMAVT